MIEYKLCIYTDIVHAYICIVYINVCSCAYMVVGGFRHIRSAIFKHVDDGIRMMGRFQFDFLVPCSRGNVYDEKVAVKDKTKTYKTHNCFTCSLFFGPQTCFLAFANL